jgi:hypothetical protein
MTTSRSFSPEHSELKGILKKSCDSQKKKVPCACEIWHQIKKVSPSYEISQLKKKIGFNLYKEYFVKKCPKLARF